MENISEIVLAAVKVIEKAVPGVKVEILETKRNEPTVKHPFGQLGAVATFSWEIGEERVEKVKTFLTCQLCEDMLTPIGHLVAEEIVYMLYKEIFWKMEDELDL